MAATLVTPRPAALNAASMASERQQLRLEKLGVIAGFLFGLLLTIHLEVDVLGAAPPWLATLAAGLTVAATTRLGLMVGAALARRLAR